MEPLTPTPATLEEVLARLADLEAAHTRQSMRMEALARENARLRRPAPGFGRHQPAVREANAHPAAPDRRTSRRGMLGTAAKVAAATVAAGVLAEQLGTRAAFASSPGTFSSNTSGIPAVSATGTSGAHGVDASSDSGDGVFATTASSSFAYAIHGSNTSNTGGSVAVLGHADNGSGGLGPGTGVKGETAGGIGVLGTASAFAGIGVVASAAGDSGFGVSATTSGTTTYGVYANCTGTNSTAVNANATASGGIGVSAAGDTYGVFANAANGTGVSATGTDFGVSATASAASGWGVYAQANATNGTGVFGGGSASGSTGVAGNGVRYGVSGDSNTGTGVFGIGGSYGVYGTTNSGTGVGVYGTTSGGIGVYGTSSGGASKQAVQGVGTAGAAGLRATSDSGNGIVAASTTGTGLNVQSATGSAVIATSSGVGYGLYLTAPSGWAIGCVGRVRILGAAVGTVTLAHGTTSKTVSTNACSSSSQVILTPTSNPQVSIWATAAPGSFTIHASSAPSADVTFSYFLIN